MFCPDKADQCKYQMHYTNYSGQLIILESLGDELPPVIEPETLALLKSLRLEITPHADRSYGYGYNWGDLEWVGPYPTEGAAVQTAFEDAIRARIARTEAPFATEVGQLVRWDGSEWESAK